MKRLLILISCISYVVFGLIVSTIHIPCAEAADINVPDDYFTIQEAIDAVSDGDVVIVGLGTYVENINFFGKTITVKSTDPNDPDVVAATIIDGNQVDIVVTFNNGESPDSILSGFTVQNRGDSGQGGIYCYDSSPTISDCVITQNDLGILISQSYPRDFYPNIINCTISQNFYAGIQCQGSVNINNCIISENEWGIYCSQYTDISPWSLISAKPTINNCHIINNNSSGIWDIDSSPTISNCTISQNGGRGISCEGQSSPAIINCVIAHNSGGGFSCTCKSTWFYPLPTPWFKIPIFKYSRPKIINCTITENQVPDGRRSSMGGAIHHNGNSFVTITNCILWGNSPGEVDHGDASFHKITYSDIQADRWKYPGIGNINTNPLFVDPEAGDYRLQPGSPCIKNGKRLSDMGAYGTYKYKISTSRSRPLSKKGAIGD